MPINPGYNINSNSGYNINSNLISNTNNISSGGIKINPNRPVNTFGNYINKFYFYNNCSIIKGDYYG